MDGEREHDGQIHTLGLLEQLREDLRRYGHENGELYHRVDKALRELANPNLHDVELAHAFRIELWDRYGKDNLRMTIAATSSIVIAHAAFDVAITEYANERLIADKRAVSGMPGRLDRWRQSGPGDRCLC
jgi:hypothetical protein